ncbi:MAG: recombinase family protein [Eubacteriales bacterium]
MNKKKYRAALYARISKEDTNKAESESIKNQIDLMEAFVANHEEIEISCVRADDGFSGVNLDRPQFRLMEEEIAKGAVNCVIVKDDSVIIEPNRNSD